jgi:hypothetical protein
VQGAVWAGARAVAISGQWVPEEEGEVTAHQSEKRVSKYAGTKRPVHWCKKHQKEQHLVIDPSTCGVYNGFCDKKAPHRAWLCPDCEDDRARDI